MKNVYCLINVFGCFVIVSKFVILLRLVNGGWRVYGMGGSCFTDVLLHSSISYHQEHAFHTATVPYMNEHAACGAVISL